MRRLLTTISAFFTLSGALLAVPVINIYPSVGPNPFASPNISAYYTNAISALGSNSSSAGIAGTPGYYERLSGNLNPYSILFSDLGTPPFNSWNGVANPGGAFAGEFGNFLYFGLRIEDTSGTFSLSQLAIPNDNLFGDQLPCSAPCFSDYRTDLLGINYGADNAPGGAGANADTVITSGASTQQVNLLLYRGNALGFNAGAYGTGQAALDAAAAAVIASAPGLGALANSFTIYQLGTQPPVQSTVNFTLDVPEPSTFSFLALGLAGLMAVRRRK